MLFHDRLYIGGDVHITEGFNERNILWSFTTDLSSWSLSYVPVNNFGLATYKSWLVLVGGWDSDSREVSNKLWTSDDGLRWQEETLSPMLTPRRSPLAVSIDSPACLIVAGGDLSRNALHSVEFFKEGQWSVVEPLPHHFVPRNSTLHNGILYMCQANKVLCCNLDEVINKSTNKSEAKSSGLWRTVKMPGDNYFLHNCLHSR